MPVLHGTFKAAMLQRVANVTLFSADPINAFAAWIRFRLWLVERSFASGIDLLNTFSLLLRLLLGHFLHPAHFLGDLLLDFFRIPILIDKLRVFVRARIGLFQKLFVVMLIPLFLRIFLLFVMFLDGLRQ